MPPTAGASARRKPTIPAQQVEAIAYATLPSRPAGATHWSSCGHGVWTATPEDIQAKIRRRRVAFEAIAT